MALIEMCWPQETRQRIPRALGNCSPCIDATAAGPRGQRGLEFTVPRVRLYTPDTSIMLHADMRMRQALLQWKTIGIPCAQVVEALHVDESRNP